MLIRILHSFLNRNINIIMDCCYLGNPTSSQIVKFLYKNMYKKKKKKKKKNPICPTIYP